RGDARAESGDRVPDHDAGVDRSAGIERLRRRIPGVAGSLASELHVVRLRGARRDLVGVLHAVALSTNLLRTTFAFAQSSYDRSQFARMGRGASAGVPHVLDGNLFAKLHARDQYAERVDPAARERFRGS